MQFDPESRQAKYAPLREEVLTRGLQAEILIGECESDAMIIWSGGSAHDPRTGSGRVVVNCRRRGWFVSVSNRMTYRIPNRDAVHVVVLGVVAAMRERQNDEAFARIVGEFMLTPIEQTTWHQQEGEEQRLVWEESGWFVLSQSEETQAWGRFNDLLLGSDGDLRLPLSTSTWGLPDLSDETVEESSKTEGLLTVAVFDALRHCTREGQHVLALDWDHPCYRFLPHLGVRMSYRDFWAVPIWPRGGAYYFVAPGFEYGVLASHAGKLHIFGQELADASHDAVTKLLGPPTRGVKTLHTIRREV